MHRTFSNVIKLCCQLNLMLPDIRKGSNSSRLDLKHSAFLTMKNQSKIALGAGIEHRSSYWDVAEGSPHGYRLWMRELWKYWSMKVLQVRAELCKLQGQRTLFHNVTTARWVNFAPNRWEELTKVISGQPRQTNILVVKWRLTSYGRVMKPARVKKDPHNFMKKI